MSEAFDILSGALDEAIVDARSTEPVQQQEPIFMEIEPMQSYTAGDSIAY